MFLESDEFPSNANLVCAAASHRTWPHDGLFTNINIKRIVCTHHAGKLARVTPECCEACTCECCLPASTRVV